MSNIRIYIFLTLLVLTIVNCSNLKENNGTPKIITKYISKTQDADGTTTGLPPIITGAATDKTTATDDGTTSGKTSTITEKTTATDDGTTSDNTSTTGGTITDKTTATDAGPTSDKTTTTDAGTTSDNTSTTDGTTSDKTTTTDAGTTSDKTSTTDAGTTSDKTTTTDAGTTSDKTSTTDAGTTGTTKKPSIPTRHKDEDEPYDDSSLISGTVIVYTIGAGCLIFISYLLWKRIRGKRVGGNQIQSNSSKDGYVMLNMRD